MRNLRYARLGLAITAIGRMRERCGPALIPLALSILPAFPLSAAEAVLKDGRIIIYHRDAQYLNATVGGDTRHHDLSADQTLVIRRGERVTIVVADPNPFLFSYQAGEIEKTETENYKAAVAFGQTLASLAAHLAPIAGRAASPTERAQLLESNLDLFADVDPSVFAEMKVEAKKKPHIENKASSRIDEIVKAAGIDEPGKFLGTIATDFKSLGEDAESIAELLKQSAGGIEDVKAAKARVANWQLDALERRLTGAFTRIGAINAQLLRELDTVAPALGAHPFYLGSNLAKQEQPEILRTLETAAAFSEKMKLVDKELRLRTVDYDSTHDSSVKLTITSEAENAPLAKDTSRPVGEFVFRFKPYSPVILGVGAAAVYSFVEAPSFKAETDGSSFRVVEENSDQYHGIDVAAMLTITPRRWEDPTFGGLFELGVNPKGHLGLFAGAGFTIKDIFTFGGGLAFQQVDELVSLHPGDLIPAADELKTRKRFKTGLYLHVTLSADFTKK